jgi:hypothetical protein
MIMKNLFDHTFLPVGAASQPAHRPHGHHPPLKSTARPDEGTARRRGRKIGDRHGLGSGEAARQLRAAGEWMLVLAGPAGRTRCAGAQSPSPGPRAAGARRT